MSDEVQKTIDETVKSNKVVIFMKGTPTFPQCGFSAATVAVLKELGVPFKAVNVLEDMAVREGVKKYSNWPTIPQLYVGGQFVGGCDIVREMHAAGELKPLVDKALAEA
ncbi:MAG TPA: Grx4 family monothiol glutaredoxin [Myxococcota bacterium]|nr:Grx4 family monothiol glutaredoxin [Myxococcota bacterium]